MRIMLRNCFSCKRLSFVDDNPGGLFREKTELKSVVAGMSPSGIIGGSGIWIMPSYINHSCWPNSVRSFLGDLLIVRAARDIQEGEEITMNYLDNESCLQNRQEELYSGWGFNCKCTLCEIETAESQEVQNKRQELMDKASNFETYLKRPLKKTNSGIAPLIVLIKGIEATYTKPEFIQPRVQLISPADILQTFLVRAERLSDVSLLAKEALNGLGFKITTREGKVVIERYGYMSYPVMQLFVRVITAEAMVGDLLTATLWKDAAVGVYEVLGGEKESFFDAFGTVLSGVGVPFD